MSTSYYVEILGRLWMPQCHTAKQITITPEDLERAGHSEARANDEDGGALAAIDMYVSTHEGDFSSIEALRVVKLEREDFQDGAVYAGGWNVQRILTRETVLRAFTDEEDEAYNACYFDYEDDDDEDA